MQPQHIGIYPGTFDPIHKGHISFALETIRTCGLDKVIFLPELRPRVKTVVTPIAHRTAMIELAIADIPSLSFVMLDDERFDVSNTLPKLRELLKGANMMLLIGSDVAHTLHTWRGIATLTSEISFAIGMRTNDRKNEIAKIMYRLSEGHSNPVVFTIIDTPSQGIASSQVRKGNKTYLSLHHTTLDYINQHQLYATY